MPLFDNKNIVREVVGSAASKIWIKAPDRYGLSLQWLAQVQADSAWSYVKRVKYDGIPELGSGLYSRNAEYGDMRSLK